MSALSESTDFGGGNVGVLLEHPRRLEGRIAQGLNIEREGLGRRRLIHRSVIAGRVDALAVLITHGARIDVGDSMGHTPLHWAANKNHMECARYLIDAGASLSPRNFMGSTPLHMACAHHHLPMARLLIASGADLDILDEAGLTALHWAVNERHLAIAQALCEAGADMHIKSNHKRETPWSLALRSGEDDFVRLMELTRAQNIIDTRLDSATGHIMQPAL